MRNTALQYQHGLAVQNDPNHISSDFGSLDRDGSGGLDSVELTERMRICRAQKDGIHAVVDELAKAVSKIIYPALKPEGFRRARGRDLIRVESGIVQRLYFQVSGGGSRDFCVTACANLVAANEEASLQPGFRLTREPGGGDLWLPSKTAREAQRSAEVILEAIVSQALPYFEPIRTLAGYATLLSREHWGSAHHLSFERGVAAALMGDAPAARLHLAQAIRLYEADGRDWCAAYAQKANDLQNAIGGGRGEELLMAWCQSNSRAHGIS